MMDQLVPPTVLGLVRCFIEHLGLFPSHTRCLTRLFNSLKYFGLMGSGMVRNKYRIFGSSIILNDAILPIHDNSNFASLEDPNRKRALSLNGWNYRKLTHFVNTLVRQ